MSTYVIAGTLEVEKMLCLRMANTIVLLDEALETTNKIDRAVVGRIKGLCLNMAALPRETLYQLQDGIIAKLHAKEGHTI